MKDVANVWHIVSPTHDKTVCGIEVPEAFRKGLSLTDKNIIQLIADDSHRCVACVAGA